MYYTIVDKDFWHVPPIEVDGEHHRISEREWCLVDILGGEGYMNVRPLGLGNGAFDSCMTYVSVIVSVLPLGVEVGIGTSGNCKECAMSWECFVLLLGFLGLWRRLWLWIGFIFGLGVIVLHWVGDLRNSASILVLTITTHYPGFQITCYVANSASRPR
jgi:hypothetical protein